MPRRCLPYCRPCRGKQILALFENRCVVRSYRAGKEGITRTYADLSAKRPGGEAQRTSIPGCACARAVLPQRPASPINNNPARISLGILSLTLPLPFLDGRALHSWCWRHCRSRRSCRCSGSSRLRPRRLRQNSGSRRLRWQLSRLEQHSQLGLFVCAVAPGRQLPGLVVVAAREAQRLQALPAGMSGVVRARRRGSGGASGGVVASE